MARNKRAWLTGNTLSGDTERVLVIPGDLNMVMAVNGALLPLTYAENWEQFGSLTPEQCATAMRTMYFDWIESEAPMTGLQSRISFWHRWDEVLFGAAISTIVDAACLFAHYVTMVPAAQSDARIQVAWLPAGDYEMRVLYQRLANNGNLTVFIQNSNNITMATPINAVDIHGATLRNQVLSATFTLPEDGLMQFIWQIPSKNAASTGFNCPLTMTEVWRVSD